ncbi:formin domain-containing protein [Tieghemostelium lacteum]|uniref:Formin domain-containing protein n=1 Tax=Tieghemostelium lacteum TaxID=361077 RepID=A0A151Z4G1_TIELA|nr:formin domain-containing protein [Tieghemostelium lacteum]|eukprot:KYQ88849.1 formin domain-containing protein [Tieghemostelium lacteum]
MLSNINRLTFTGVLKSNKSNIVLISNSSNLKFKGISNIQNYKINQINNVIKYDINSSRSTFRKCFYTTLNNNSNSINSSSNSSSIPEIFGENQLKSYLDTEIRDLLKLGLQHAKSSKSNRISVNDKLWSLLSLLKSKKRYFWYQNYFNAITNLISSMNYDYTPEGKLEAETLLAEEDLSKNTRELLLTWLLHYYSNVEKEDLKKHDYFWQLFKLNPVVAIRYRNELIEASQYFYSNLDTLERTNEIKEFLEKVLAKDPDNIFILFQLASITHNEARLLQIVSIYQKTPDHLKIIKFGQYGFIWGMDGILNMATSSSIILYGGLPDPNTEHITGLMKFYIDNIDNHSLFSDDIFTGLLRFHSSSNNPKVFKMISDLMNMVLKKFENVKTQKMDDLRVIAIKIEGKLAQSSLDSSVSTEGSTMNQEEVLDYAEKNKEITKFSVTVCGLLHSLIQTQKENPFALCISSITSHDSFYVSVESALTLMSHTKQVLESIPTSEFIPTQLQYYNLLKRANEFYISILQSLQGISPKEFKKHPIYQSIKLLNRMSVLGDDILKDLLAEGQTKLMSLEYQACIDTVTKMEKILRYRNKLSLGPVAICNYFMGDEKEGIKNNEEFFKTIQSYSPKIQEYYIGTITKFSESYAIRLSNSNQLKKLEKHLDWVFSIGKVDKKDYPLFLEYYAIACGLTEKARDLWYLVMDNRSETPITSAWHNLSDIYFQHKNIPKALECLDKAEEECEKHFPGDKQFPRNIILAKINILHIQDEKDKILELLPKLVKTDPECADTYAILSDMADQENKPEEAMELAKKAIELCKQGKGLDPKVYLDAYHSYASALFSIPKYKESFQIFLEAIQILYRTYPPEEVWQRMELFYMTFNAGINYSMDIFELNNLESLSVNNVEEYLNYQLLDIVITSPSEATLDDYYNCFQSLLQLTNQTKEHCVTELYQEIINTKAESLQNLLISIKILKEINPEDMSRHLEDLQESLLITVSFMSKLYGLLDE